MKSILKKLVLLGIVAIIGFTTVSLPLENYAFADDSVITNDPINMIKQTENEFIYEVEENGEWSC